ncbi:hypothetical protein [Streptomyces sp. MUM 178J]|uniref:hypothetical protein n=1 Tax=Streptomyces sp. MUM 178J TaxID=2791991 RepID=UPI001F035132|nr:hypothetical protein [Streptomyces sp. MUM 178J]WRQ83227.1 hypothetical protein I3F59_003530 [Streptomyces sp. MUM 178J]
MLAETICSAVSAAGLGIAAITAYRKRFLAAARIAAYSLVPIGLVLTGAVEWAVDTAFSPTAWVGFGLLGGAWLLFMTTRAVERRSTGARKESAAVEPGASKPSLGAGGPAAGRQTKPAKPAKGAQPSKSKAAGDGDDFSDIEAILKKHGI